MLIGKLQEKCPLKYTNVRYLDCLDPRLIVNKPEVAETHFTELFWRLSQTKRVKQCDGDKISRLFSTYVAYMKINNLLAFMNFNPHTMAVDTFHHIHMGGEDKFEELWPIVKMLLILSHGQAAIERGFSVNKECSEDNQSEKGVIARHQVLDGIRCAGGVLNVKLTPSLKVSCRGARQKYHANLKNNPRNDSEETKKRKREEEKELILRKKQKLQLELQMLDTNLKGLSDVPDGSS